MLVFVRILFPPMPTADGTQPLTPQAQAQAIEFANSLSPFSSEFVSQLWSFLAPILSVIITVVLVRWILFAGKNNGFGNRLGNLIKDVPSLVAILVTLSLCVMPILKIEIPDVLSNIALVIVGFYTLVAKKNDS